jgi:hypothetical protein
MNNNNNNKMKFCLQNPKQRLKWVKILKGFLVWKTQTNNCRKPIHWALKKKRKKIIGHDRVPLPLTSPLAKVCGIDPKSSHILLFLDQ